MYGCKIHILFSSDYTIEWAEHILQQIRTDMINQNYRDSHGGLYLPANELYSIQVNGANLMIQLHDEKGESIPWEEAYQYYIDVESVEHAQIFLAYCFNQWTILIPRVKKFK